MCHFRSLAIDYLPIVYSATDAPLPQKKFAARLLLSVPEACGDGLVREFPRLFPFLCSLSFILFRPSPPAAGDSRRPQTPAPKGQQPSGLPPLTPPGCDCTLPIVNNLLTISPAALRRAADIQERIDALQSELSQLLNSEAPAHQLPGRRKMSAQGLANIRAGVKRRWAGFKRADNTAPRRRMSAAAKARLAAIARARWRRAKASGRNAL